MPKNWGHFDKLSGTVEDDVYKEKRYLTKEKWERVMSFAYRMCSAALKFYETRTKKPVGDKSGGGVTGDLKRRDHYEGDCGYGLGLNTPLQAAT